MGYSRDERGDLLVGLLEGRFGNENSMGVKTRDSLFGK